jgi:hypothetical protein
MIFDLVQDLAAVLDALPAEHSRRRLLRLLQEALRRDGHFLVRHPTTLFQCLWSSCWWYDCPQAPADPSARHRLSNLDVYDCLLEKHPYAEVKRS